MLLSTFNLSHRSFSSAHRSSILPFVHGHFSLSLYSSTIHYERIPESLSRSLVLQQPMCYAMAAWSTLKGHSDQVLSVIFSPDGTKLASASYDRTVKIWDTAKSVLLRTLSGHTEPVYSVAFSQDSKRLASGSRDKTVRLWSVDRGNCLQTLQINTSPVYSVTFSPDGSMLASGSDKAVHLWDINEGTSLLALSHNDVKSVIFSTDGKALATASCAMVQLWEAETGKLLQTLKCDGAESTPIMISFLHDSTLLMWASAHIVLCWHVATGIQHLKNHMVERLVGLSRDGERMASMSSEYGMAHIWDTKTVVGKGCAPRKVDDCDRPLYSLVEFSPHGDQVACAFEGNNVHLLAIITAH